jgi:hypothetical protein
LVEKTLQLMSEKILKSCYRPEGSRFSIVTSLYRVLRREELLSQDGQGAQDSAADGEAEVLVAILE